MGWEGIGERIDSVWATIDILGQEKKVLSIREISRLKKLWVPLSNLERQFTCLG